ncbi:MAG: ureidoglycolate hydrolase [Lachnospiraceae bacterium]|nr:ureidoglycolate hydrolase [Lachnospiraceae bacterium]
MKTIKAKPITVENFSYYGQFTSLLDPSGYSLGDFYHDRVRMNMAGNMNLAFSPLVVHKSEPRIVSQAEYHNTTPEGILCLDDDVILHVAPPSKEPVPELTEAFIVPKGTLVCLNLGVWHLSAMPVNLETAHVLIVLPERIYLNDCIVVDYPPEKQVMIEI